VVGVPPQNPIDRAIVDVPTLGVNLHPTRSLSGKCSPKTVSTRSLRAETMGGWMRREIEPKRCG
jgi:hypothetical protein